MKKKYRLISKFGNSYIQRLTIGLFGEQWETIASFVGCENECKQIVQQLNNCEKLSQKNTEQHDDRRRNHRIGKDI